MPIFVDTDPALSRLILTKLKRKSHPRTRAHYACTYSWVALRYDKNKEIANKHNLLVVEDACQAWMAEVDHKKVGTFGNAGCFSFQNSKHLPIGEGGAIVSNDEEFMDRCFSYHNCGRAYGNMVDQVGRTIYNCC